MNIDYLYRDFGLHYADVAASLSGCVLCGRKPIEMVGVFMPTEDEEMVAAILKLRTKPLPDGRSPGVCYGLCRLHAQDFDTSVIQVEAYLLRAAARVVVQ